ncbi:MAG: hypothetical protein HQ481_19690 [Alphaproteobacteria bacterium]|nr:hypothetical protein [Alphaproteobacteria bacterium]
MNRYLALLSPIALALALFATPIPAALADDPEGDVIRQGTADDEVIFTVAVESWVETTTATVRLAADLAVEAGGFGTARTELVATLKTLGAGAGWRIVDFSKGRDEAGFERWRVVAEARVPETTLSDLAARARAASKPGRALSVADIDYTPTLVEREAVINLLRGRVYSRVAEEIGTLDAVFSDRKFRVRLIDFTQDFQPQPRLMREGMVAMARSDGSQGAGGLAGAEKVHLVARVHLAARAAE